MLYIDFVKSCNSMINECISVIALNILNELVESCWIHSNPLDVRRMCGCWWCHQQVATCMYMTYINTGCFCCLKGHVQLQLRCTAQGVVELLMKSLTIFAADVEIQDVALMLLSLSQFPSVFILHIRACLVKVCENMWKYCLDNLVIYIYIFCADNGIPGP